MTAIVTPIGPFTILGILTMLIALCCIRNRRLAGAFVLFTLPFYRVVVGFAIGHAFNVPEVAALTLGGSLVFEWLTEGELTIPRSSVLVWVGLFWVVCIFSVITLVFFPTQQLGGGSMMVHPYNTGALDDLAKQPLHFSRNNITQLLLRTVTVGSIVVYCIGLRDVDLGAVLRTLIGSSLAVAIIGFVYQATQLIGWNWVAQLWVDLGFRIRPNGGQFAGVLPRMWSLPGEPGFTATYLLFGLAIAGTLTLMPSQTVLSHTKAVLASAALVVSLLLTTSTTGYGGLAILATTVVVAGFVFEEIELQLLRTPVLVGLPITLLLGCLVILLSPVDFLSIVAFQVHKLTFSAGSGSLRIKYFVWSLRVGVNSSFLGVGVGSHYGATLLGTIFAETGLLGVSAFAGLIIAGIRSTVRSTDPRAPVLAVVLFMVIGTVLMAKSITALRFPWLWLAIAFPSIVSQRSVVVSGVHDVVSLLRPTPRRG